GGRVELVSELCRDGAGEGRHATGPGGLGGQRGKGGTNRLAPISARRAPLGVEEPEVVTDHSPDLGCQSVQGISKSRPDHITGPAQGRWGGSGRAGHAGTASVTFPACPNQPKPRPAAAVPEPP